MGYDLSLDGLRAASGRSWDVAFHYGCRQDSQGFRPGFDSREITGKIRLLNEEIEIYVEGAKETETLLQSGEA